MELREMMMADGCGYEAEAKPPALSLVGTMPPLVNGEEASVTEAAKKVADVIDRLFRFSKNDAPRNPTYGETLDDGRVALLELIETPAQSFEACTIKLTTLTQLAAWYQEGDPDILNGFMAYSHEVTGLLQQATQGRSGDDENAANIVWGRSVRWFLGMAAAVPSAFFSRWDSGGLS